MHFRKFKFVLVSLLLINFILPAPASAHSELESASPASNELVTSWPAEVTLSFNEPLLTTQSQQANALSVTDSTGTQIDLQDSAVTGNAIRVSLPGEAEPGSYFVNYRVVSADGHVIEDSYEFIFDGANQPEAISTINEEPVLISENQESESSSNLGLVLVLVTLASFAVLVVQFRKNRYK